LQPITFRGLTQRSLDREGSTHGSAWVHRHGRQSWKIFKSFVNQIPALRSKLADYAGEAGSEISAQLDRLLFGELKAFFESILRSKGKESVLDALGDDAAGFRLQVQEWSRSIIHLRGSKVEEEDELKNFENERVMSRLQ
jgi:Zn-dependent M32 family carboxypeptidase